MSINLLRKEVLRFLESDLPEVLCIKGKWGVGKTFTWKAILRQSVKDHSVAIDQYSYVSLFGLNSISSLKQAVFENIVSLKMSETSSIHSMEVSLSRMQSATRKGMRGLLTAVPFIKDSADFIMGAAFMMVQNQIICFDDLERVGDGLRAKDVMGLISLLKEEKKCKIVILLNDEKMEAGNQRDFREQLEKVVDVVLTFDPSPGESAALALEVDDDVSNLLKTGFCSLDISNIRVMKKIERLARQALDLSQVSVEAIRTQIIQTTMLAGWCNFQSGAEIPTIEFLQYFNGGKPYEDEEEGGLKSNWRDTLRDFGYLMTDELDVIIISGVARGYFDEISLNSMTKQKEKDFVAKGKTEPFAAAWKKYHGSFLPNDNEVLDDMYNACAADPLNISPMNFNAALVLLDEFGRTEQVETLIHAYVEAHGDDRKFFDLDNYPFEGEVSHLKFRQAFDERYNEIADERSPSDVLVTIGKNRGWNKVDEKLLAALDVNAFENIFGALSGDDLRFAIKGALQLGEKRSDGTSTSEIAKAALRQIAKSSPLNARRVSSYGVK